MENRNGLSVQTLVSNAHGATESQAATELSARQMDRAEKTPETLVADEGYHSAEVVGFCRDNGFKPHVATVKGGPLSPQKPLFHASAVRNEVAELAQDGDLRPG